MKILAMYLPQYHEVEENNKWWGKGYTEWDAVRNAKPLFKGHIQPKVPLGDNYYDLSDTDAKTWAWQASLAKQYGVYGFCIYHYWFKNGHQLLEKPMEILLKHPEIRIHFSICWANETWKRTWYGHSNEILLEQAYGDETEWIEHFNYLLPFFKDDRYIKVLNRPMVNIYRTFEIKDFSHMKACWNKLAKDNGFDGVYFVSGAGMHGMDCRQQLFDAFYYFPPGFTLAHNLSMQRRLLYEVKGLGSHLANFFSAEKKLERKINIKWLYNATVSFLKKYKESDVIIFPGICPMWDNTPRRGYLGFVTVNANPKTFYIQLLRLKGYIPKPPLDYIYINAWNEWGEGAYLEPDKYHGYGYLESIMEAVIN